jgi:hypothetical protein
VQRIGALVQRRVLRGNARDTQRAAEEVLEHAVSEAQLELGTRVERVPRAPEEDVLPARRRRCAAQQSARAGRDAGRAKGGRGAYPRAW